MVEITLKKIDKTNYRDAIKLTVRDDQRSFIAPNDKSLIQSAYEAPEASTPYGIYADETMVGFTLVTSDDEDPEAYWIWRFMIGADYQGKGYGKAALQEIIQIARSLHKYKYLRLSYVPENTGAKAFYAGSGFVEEGIKEDWGEMVAAYDLSQGNTG